MQDVWNERAAKIAQYISEEMTPAHRGAISTDEFEVVAIFGNDGHHDNPRRQVAELVQEKLAAENVERLGFGVCESNYCWVLLVDGGGISPEHFNFVVWQSWREIFGRKEMFGVDHAYFDSQLPIAQAEITNHSPLVCAG